MQKKINFNAGPTEVPPEVLHEAAKSLRKYGNTGLTVVELPHRGADFKEILDECNALVRELCGIGDEFEVLWMQGGGRLQFAMLPMNFLAGTAGAGYIDSGHWAAEAAEYAKFYGNAPVLASSAATNYNRLPEWPEVPADLSYLHVTTNNTIYGTQWPKLPKTSVPLVADVSSDILSGKRDYSKYSMFYAAGQKNLGIAGVTLVVIRKDFLKRAATNMPPMLSYKAQIKENSILNTPNGFGLYVSLLMLRWIKSIGLEKLERDNSRKAQMLYTAIDNSRLFKAHVAEKAHRSLMNVSFTGATPAVEQKLLELCEKAHITGIKGHRAAGGFRVSLYNAIPVESVESLLDVINFMEQTV